VSDHFHAPAALSGEGGKSPQYNTAGLDVVPRRKKSHHLSCRELNPGYPTRSLVSILIDK